MEPPGVRCPERPIHQVESGEWSPLWGSPGGSGAPAMSIGWKWTSSDDHWPVGERRAFRHPVRASEPAVRFIVRTGARTEDGVLPRLHQGTARCAREWSPLPPASPGANTEGDSASGAVHSMRAPLTGCAAGFTRSIEWKATLVQLRVSASFRCFSLTSLATLPAMWLTGPVLSGCGGEISPSRRTAYRHRA